MMKRVGRVSYLDGIRIPRTSGGTLAAQIEILSWGSYFPRTDRVMIPGSACICPSWKSPGDVPDLVDLLRTGL